MTELSSQANLVGAGNLDRTKAMLINQAHTLDAIFNNLARRSALNAGEYLGACDTYMRRALRAQSQCRATLETLGEIVNPSAVAFVRQANIAHGPQQVNNGPPPAEASRAGQSELRQSKLLEQQCNERMDAGAAHAAGSGNSTVEALGVVNGTKDDGG
jgi:hypothetical protein